MGSPPGYRFAPISEETARLIYRQGEDEVVRYLINLSTKTGTALADLAARIAVLEAKQSKDSHNSNKPPSSDGPARPPRPNNRPPTNKKPGGQNGHDGNTLQMSATPDKVVRHTVNKCGHCHNSLAGVVADYLRRQVFDLPPIKISITEHRAESKSCPHCGKINHASFPDTVQPGATYGDNFKALALYLQHQHLLPYDRTADILRDLTGHRPSPGTLANFQRSCAQRLSAVEQAIIERLLDAPLIHVDETGVHCMKTLHWLHSLSTTAVTFYGVDAKRGREAMERIGILPRFTGKVVHDHWQSYFEYACEHVLCNAHHLRELLHIAEEFHERWAARMRHLLLLMKRAVERAAATGASALSPQQRRRYHRLYDRIITAGRLYHGRLGPPGIKATGTRGKQKQWPGKNLLDRLRQRKAETLAFLKDFSVPFTNNLAERDLRMAKVKEKISGCFRSVAAAGNFFRIRGYISTARKQGWDILSAIGAAVRGAPFLPSIS